MFNQQLNFKQWMIKNRNRFIAVISVIIILSLLVIGQKVPAYIQMYKHVQSAQISMANDDLEGTIVSYEKAYELVPSQSLEEDIEHIKLLIKSKTNFLRGQQSEADEHYEAAYYYYHEVLPIDESRYVIAQEKIPLMSEMIVEDIYKQVDEYYENHLYLLIIARLQSALEYNVKVDETLEKIENYRQVLYQYYVERAQREAEIYWDNDNFYKLFIRSIDEALKYVDNEIQKEEVVSLKQQLINTTIDLYFEQAQEYVTSSNDKAAQVYVMRILELDSTNEQAIQMLDALNLEG